MLVDAFKELYALPERLAQLDLARSSYFYHRARAQVADKYLDARRAIADIVETNRCRSATAGSIDAPSKT